uniref:PGG domain-containing protein n=1 Tax=Oryza brachyantha TaxID=4533 RepID=J3MC46_ORYBR
MASCVPPIVLVAFVLESTLAAPRKASPPLNPVARLVADDLLLAILATFELTCLLLFAHVGSLGAGGGATRHLAITTLAAAAAAALLAATLLSHVSTTGAAAWAQSSS